MKFVYLFIGLMLFGSYMFINRAYANMYNKDGINVRGGDDYIRSIDQIVKRAEREEAEKAAAEAAETDTNEAQATKVETNEAEDKGEAE